MFQIEDLVASAFNGGSLDLDASELLEMTTSDYYPTVQQRCYLAALGI